MKRKLVIAGIALVSLLGAYGTGRYLQPAKVVEKEKIVYKEQVTAHTQVQAQTNETKTSNESAKRNTHREVTITKAPDGTITKKVVEDQKVATDEHSKDVKTEIKYVDRVVEKVVTQTVEKEKIVSAKKPSWRVGPMVGLDVRTMLGQYSQPIPQLGPVVLGVQVERRIAGPLSAGAWALTSGSAGVTLTLEW